MQKNPLMTNVVNKKILREIQQQTMKLFKEVVLPSAGPLGSTTQIITPEFDQAGRIISSHVQYTKDGHTIFSGLMVNKSIEQSLKSEFLEMTKRLVKKVGDGTTSVIVLASLIFDAMIKLDIEKDGQVPPYLIIQIFQEVVAEMQDIIKANSRELTLDDVYKIAMISTNSNEEVSRTLQDIYKEHGLGVFIEVGTSPEENSLIKTYDGMTLAVGYSDPVYINTLPSKDKNGNIVNADSENGGFSIIRNASIYAFVDPIDTQEQHNFLNAIIYNNIMKPYNDAISARRAGSEPAFEAAMKTVVPTVILCKKISLDLSKSFDDIVEFMYKFDPDQKPPLLIISNINSSTPGLFESYSDIWKLCGCTPIKKYIDPEIQKKEIEEGIAPTPQTVCNFCGHADEVKATAFSTIFTNPHKMFEVYEEDVWEERTATDTHFDNNGAKSVSDPMTEKVISHRAGDRVLDEDGNPVYSKTFKSITSFLQAELDTAISNGRDYNEIGSLRARLQSLKSNMVEYLIGGIATTDRDSVEHLVEDAVKNLRSAAVDGVGFGTNFEGYRAITTIMQNVDEDKAENTSIRNHIKEAIRNAYFEMGKTLYGTVYYDVPAEEKDALVESLVKKSLTEGCPINFKNKEFDGSVLCTALQDIEILNVISKIITIVYTTNQAMVPSPSHNLYVE